MQKHNSLHYTRVGVLFGALATTFFAYVHQVKTLEQDAVEFQAHMLERSGAMEVALSEIAMTIPVSTSAETTVHRRISTTNQKARTRALQMARRNQRKAEDVHSAATKKVPCEE